MNDRPSNPRWRTHLWLVALVSFVSAPVRARGDDDPTLAQLTEIGSEVQREIGPAASADLPAAWARLRAEPGSLAAYRRALDLAFLAGRTEEAVQELRQIAGRRVDDAAPRVALAICERRLGRLAEARASLEVALHHEPGSLPALRELLVVARARGELEGTIRDLETRARSDAAPSPALRLAMATGHQLAFDFATAKRLLAAGGPDGESAAALLTLAAIKFDEGDLTACHELAERARRLTSDRHDAFRLEAEILEARCQSDVKRSAASFMSSVEAGREAGDWTRVADCLRELVRLLSKTADHAALRPVLQTALAIHEALREEDAVAVDLQAFGCIPGAVRPLELLEILSRSLDLARRLGNRRTQARALAGLGGTLLGLGRYSESVSHGLQGLGLAERIGARRSQGVHAANVALGLMVMGDLDRSLVYYERALRLYGETGMHTGQLLAQAGELRFRRGEYKESESLFDAAIAAFRAPESPADDPCAYLGLARVREVAGRAEEALELDRLALRTARRANDRFHIGEAHLALGEALLGAGRPGEAAVELESALAVPGAEDDLPERAFSAHHGLALASLALGQTAQALDHYRQSIEWVEALRAQVKLSSLRSLYLRRKGKIFVDTVDLLFDLHQQEPTAGRDREAFVVAERARARVLLEIVAGMAPAAVHTSAESARIRKRVSWLQSRLLRGDLDPPESRRLQSRMDRDEAELGDLELAALKDKPQGRYRPIAPMTVERVAAALPEDTVLLEFLLGEPHSYLFVVRRPSEVRIHRLPSRGVIEASIRRLRGYVSRRPDPAHVATDLRRSREAGTAVFDIVLGPVRELVTRTTRLVVVPDGLLHYLPFEALAPAEGEPYLGESAAISYVSSASVFTLLSEASTTAAPGKGRQMIAFGDPTFHGGSAARPERVAELERGGFSLSPLPASRREALAIARLFERAAARAYLGDEFREERVIREVQRPARYVHFATHALLDERVPLRSAIVVSRRPEWQAEDGLIQARDIVDLRIPADLVTLSACQTALGDVVDGEGLIGLARAFQIAGVRSIVASLWSVSDHSTGKLMAAFYRSLKAGQGKSQSLRAARWAFIHGRNPTLRHPYYWAGFVLIGSP